MASHVHEVRKKTANLLRRAGFAALACFRITADGQLAQAAAFEEIQLGIDPDGSPPDQSPLFASRARADGTVSLTRIQTDEDTRHGF